jgi:phospholipid/cholesterol/gamma-HCH transport system ATP-binding protein
MNAPNEVAVAFDHVSKAFHAKAVLDDVSFAIPTGEALCILGRSGAGKSVTLKLMIGLLKPDAGAVCVHNRRIDELDEDGLSQVRRQMGFLFQSAALFDSFSLNDNLLLPLQRFTTKSKAELDARIQELLDQVGLGEDRYKMPAELSGGMRKRAGLARALSLEPSILLVDEPSSGLDRVSASEIDELLLGIKKKGKTTMVIVTHDIRGARRVGDRLAVLDRGKLAAIGTAKELEGNDNELVRALVSEED